MAAQIHVTQSCLRRHESLSARPGMKEVSLQCPSGVGTAVATCPSHRLLLELLGSPTRARTWDLRINSPSLYQLSYRGSEALNYSFSSQTRSNRIYPAVTA